MDEFILKIDKEKFRSTNGAWNDLMLNDPWSVGYVSTLIEAKNWKSKEEWEETYYASGEVRNKLIERNAQNFGLSPDFFNDITIPYNKSKYHLLSWDIKNLNTQKGRTREDFKSKGKILYDAVKDNGYDLSLNECIECVRFRVICETWNGIILRENNTISSLHRLFPNLTFEKVDGEMDHTYAVDFQVFNSGYLMCAIQIKPKTYLGSAPYIRKARIANENKYAAYKEKYGAPVLTVISKTNGEILNGEVISQIKALM
ncbi:MAG: MjaI family restriction endonuclease [Muribaculaceae bacterium]|nr:MjaI family restriction endonuclease [Muribaculaceae bacterium]